MIKFVICEDSDEALETAGKYVIKAMMNYDIEYKVLKFKEYNNKFKKVMDDDTDIKIYKKVLDISIFRAIISMFGSRRRYSSVGRATDL